MPRRMVCSASMVALALGVFMATLSSPASAGWTFRRMVSSRGTGLSTTEAQRVWVEGASYRVETEHEPDAAFASDVVISTDLGESEIALNTKRQTWFDNLAWRGGSAPSSRLFRLDLPSVGPATPRNVRLDLVDLGEGPRFEDRATRRYLLRLSYKLEGKVGTFKVSARVEVTAEATTVPFLEEIRFVAPELRLRTGFPETDQALGEKMNGIRGFPVDFQLSVTQHIEGGEARTELKSFKVTGIEAVQVPEAAFERPKGYHLEEPVMTAPGVVRR